MSAHQALQRRELLRLFFVGGFGFLGSCGFPMNSGGHEFPENLKYDWNSPENVEAAQRLSPPTHFADPYFAGPALSPDGSLMAVALPKSPVNELAIIDLKSRRGWVLAHPNYRVMLTHPAFSPDGRSLAVVVTPPTYYGSSELWITAPEGGRAQVISDTPSGLFTLPAFSPDSKKIVCFAEADAPPADKNGSYGRSYRTGLVHQSLHEIDLTTGAKTRLTRRAWSSVAMVAYAPRSDGFYLRTGRASVRRQSADGQVKWERAGSEFGAADRQFDGLRGYYVSRGQEPLEAPLGVIPAQISPAVPPKPQGASLLGVDGNGRLLVHAVRPNARSRFGLGAALVLWDGERVSDALAADEAYIQEGAISFDGRVAAGRATWKFEDGQSVPRPPEQATYFVQEFGSDLKKLELPDDIKFDVSRRTVVAADHSEMAS